MTTYREEQQPTWYASGLAAVPPSRPEHDAEKIERSIQSELALHAGEMARRSGQRAIELRALHDAIRFGDRTSLQRVIDIAPRVDGRLAPVYGAHAAALADRDAAAVYAAAERFERIGALLSAADAAAQASASSSNVPTPDKTALIMGTSGIPTPPSGPSPIDATVSQLRAQGRCPRPSCIGAPEDVQRRNRLVTGEVDDGRCK